jgi:diphthine-ammonia ligase
MKFVGLVSGGKDSIFNLVQCVAYGHELVCIANLHPPAQLEEKEMDSFMFQTVGVEIADRIAQCLEVPIVKAEIQGRSV